MKRKRSDIAAEIIADLKDLNATLKAGVPVRWRFPMNDTMLLPPSGKYADLPPRALLDRRDAINQLIKPTQQLELRAVVYAYGHDRFILSATTGISEAGRPVVLGTDVSDEQLGEAVFDLLLKCYAYEPQSARDAKLANWKVFVASGAKTGRAFEETSTYVAVRTVNTAIVIEARRRSPRFKTYVGRHHSITGDSETLGSSIRATIAALRLLDAQDAL